MDILKKTAALLLALLTAAAFWLPHAARADRYRVLDAALSMLEEGNPFLVHYNEDTGAEIEARFPLGCPYFWGGRRAARILETADAIFVDGTVPAETLDYLSEKYTGKSRIFFDPGSIDGGVRFAESSMKAYCVLPGRMEAEAMSGQQVLGMDQLMSAGQAFEDRGVEKVIITLKGGGLYYKEGLSSGMLKPDRKLTFAETRGAGDVLAAAVVAAAEGSTPDASGNLRTNTPHGGEAGGRRRIRAWGGMTRKPVRNRNTRHCVRN